MKFPLLGAAAVAVAAFATPALAQAVISNPGYCAQFYPDANCQNYGAGNPYTNGGYWQDGDAWQNHGASMGYWQPDRARAVHHRDRHHHHRRHPE